MQSAVQTNGVSRFQLLHAGVPMSEERFLMALVLACLFVVTVVWFVKLVIL